MTIIEAMQARRSVRSFDGSRLTSIQTELLQHAIEESYSPFGGRVTIRLKEFDLRQGFKPSTYGFIKGATTFFLLAMADDEASALTAGFQFEQVILHAWQMGLGTCWIAGTFKCSDFDRDETWPDDEMLKVVSPVGHAIDPTFREKLMRLAAGSKHRKPFDTLFFNRDCSTYVAPDNQFREALEMLRLAPSSTNSQPWRALVSGDRVDFYCLPKGPLAPLDTGIGICHFVETEKFYGYEGTFSKIIDAPQAPDNWRYLVSYSRLS
ncbi:MAG: hypothetical protein K2G35_09660 [Duncaniella sp.]|nr:hypothetical protein [Duncaniella sp.]